jgi:hypothetical protein
VDLDVLAMAAHHTAAQHTAALVQVAQDTQDMAVFLTAARERAAQAQAARVMAAHRTVVLVQAAALDMVARRTVLIMGQLVLAVRVQVVQAPLIAAPLPVLLVLPVLLGAVHRVVQELAVLLMVLYNMYGIYHYYNQLVEQFPQ